MLEGLVAGLLNRFLGMYVKDFDAKQLNVGIWSGDVKLRDLQLRREALDQLHLPVNVVEGHLGQLTMSIPWANLRGKPVKVNIENVFLLAAPKEDANYDEEEEARRAHAVKMEKLENAELLKQRNAEGLSQEEQQKNQSFVESLSTAIVDNLQVSVKNIHIRYEDSIATPGHPFALGVTLQEFSAVSTDNDWKPSYIQSTSGTTNKLAVLGALAFYWNTDTNLFGTGTGQQQGAEEQGIDRKEMIENFMKAVGGEHSNQYMLKPVSGRAAIEIDKTGKLDKPKVKARLLFHELGFVLDDHQYRDALMMVDLFHYFIRHQEYKKLQPKMTPKEDPKAWLHFAFNAVLSKIQDRNRQWTWNYIKERRDDRIRYIGLFKQKKQEEKMSAADTEELNTLEKKLSYEDLRFWRSLARNQLRKENVGLKKEPPKQTWVQWAWGGESKADEHADEDSTMNEQQRKELYDAIDWDEKKTIAESVDLPREAVKLQVESSLQTGSFTLKRDPHGKATEILSLMFDNFQAKALQRPDSFLADLSLGGMRVNDGSTEGSLFPQIVNFKSATVGKVKSSVEDIAAEDDDDDDDQEAKDKATEDALFHLIFEQNPLDESADSALTMKVKSIEVIYNPQFIVEVAKFFKPPERHMESIGALLETAGATVEGIRQQTRAGLEFALEEHKTLNANLDIQAPLIIIPESITKESALCMILDAGHVSLQSELVDKDTMKDIQSKQKKQYSENDFKKLEGLMYDKFLLKLDSTQLLLGPGIQATKDQLNEEDDPRNLRIVDRINMDFTLETSIVPKASDLTKTRITGHLPVLHASISDRKYKNLMKLIDIAIPRFDTDESLDGRTKAPTKNTRVPTAEKRTDDVMARQRSKSIATAQQGLEAYDSEDETEQGPPQKAQRKGTEEMNIHQRNFELKFQVDKLQGSLFRSDPDEARPDQLLVELVAEKFHLNFYLRPYDMVAEVVLQSVNVEDYIEEDPRPEFKKIVSSQGFGAKENKDLFNVKFVKVNDSSPEFKSTYEGIATNLDVAISTINIVVTRRTLLTLLDFVLLTFATPDQPSDKQAEIEDTPGPGNEVRESAPPTDDRIRIKVDLESVALILNNDGIRLATLTLSTANVGVFLAKGTMRVNARLGNLSLVDDVNQGASPDSPLRQLVAIQGNELADFKYQTFDSQADSFPGYDATISLRSGSVKINFLEEPFRKIINFLVKFGKMQAIFNAARQAAANQASHMQESTTKMHFDVLIKTPILVFPRVMAIDNRRDLLTAYLGEIYASNEFVTLDAKKSDFPSIEGNKISAGIRNVRLTSDFHYDEDRSEELEMIDKVDVDFQITSAEHEKGSKRPDLEVVGKMSPINLRVAQTQLRFLMELSQSVPAAFATDPDAGEEEAMAELPKATVEPAMKIAEDQGALTAPAKPPRPSHQGPELESSPDTWTKLDFDFDAPTVALELILAKEQEPVGDITSASLTKFALNNTKVKLRMKTDDSLESELLINTFTITDSRKHETNKFRRIMSLINDDVKQQFMASVTMTGGTDRHMIAMLTIDSPRIIMAIDYLLAVQSFANNAFPAKDELEVEEPTQDSALEDDDSWPTTPIDGTTPGREAKSDPRKSEGNALTMSFRINVIDAQAILIANPTIGNSEAIVLGTKQVLVSQQNASTLQITKVGMFLCRMDKFDSSRLRILDDFSITMSMDNRSQGKKSSLTSISVDIEALVLRLSLRDILLALQIVNKASEMSANINARDKMAEETPSKLKEITGTSKPASTMRKSIAPSKAASTAPKRSSKSITGTESEATSTRRASSSTMMTREELTATVEGIRVILIGDLHELPLIDWSVKKFNIDVHDWSSAMTGDTNLDTYINVYNFSKSAWEPLIEPWQLGFHISRDQSPDLLSIEMYSHKMMELTVTSATIALASKSAQFLQTDEDVLSKPRGSDAPYKVRNYTGFDLNVWAANKEEEDSAAKLNDGEEAPWRFDDPTAMRENLSPEGASGFVGIKLEGSGFDSVDRIGVNREGETLYNLKPRKDKVLHRLLVEVKLGSDNVKYITFRSPLLVENNTQIPIEIGVFSPEEGHLLKIEKIAPGEGRPAPIGAAFMHSLVVRPDQGFGYAWSNERLFWKDLLKRPTRTITCQGESNEQSPPFYFQLNASFNKNDPMTTVYPYMRLKLHAPIELQNLLPYDFKYRIYDKNTKKDWTNFLRNGGVSPVHVVELSHLLLLSIDMQDAVFKQSEFAVVNSNDQDFRRETSMPVKDSQGIELNLNLHYFNIPDSGGAFKVSVYSPYLILNRTGLEISLQSKSMFSSAKSAAGQGMKMGSGDTTQKAHPYMFSYPTEDRKNRANIKVGDSAWSKPQSLDAIGSAFEVVLPSSSSRTEMHVGISVAEGQGKYNVTKVATVTPRFILKNKLKEEINVREPASSDVVKLNSGELLPLKFLKQAPDKQLCFQYPGVNNQWSSPFNIQNVGTVHVKLARANQRQQLIRVEVIMEGATIFLHISLETKHWPFSMRNESDLEFMFYQVNPNLNEDEEDQDSAWKPIRYRLPAKSIMPYAWDYPASKNKELIVTSGNSQKRVKLAEIGNLEPMKVRGGQGRPSKIIDVNIVADGPTQTLVLSNYKPSKSLYKQKSGDAQASQASLSSGFEVKELESDVSFKAQLRLAGFGISLVNKNLKELLYVTFREIELKYGDSKLYQTLNWTIKWVQIDNQLYGGIFPILLYPSVVPKTGKEMDAHPIFHAQITRVKDDSYGVLYIKYATLLLQQMTLEVDEDFIFAMLDFMKVPGASWSEEPEGKLCDEDLDIPEPQLEQQGQDVYFELLHLQPMQLDLSFVRTERINAEDTATSSNPLVFFVNVMTMSVGNVNDAPLKLNSLMLENARISIPTLLANIQTHYTQEVLRQVHIILGSADFLGNPVGLFNNVTSGFADIFYEPYQGLVMTDRPQELGIGIAKGASSFVKKSVFGFSDSMAKFTGSMSKGLAAATMDKEYQDQRRMSKARNRPKHALYGVTSGGNAFASSMASGIGGLARQPLQGAEKEGLPGFMKGVGKGVLGLATKPAIGAFDLASSKLSPCLVKRITS